MKLTLSLTQQRKHCATTNTGAAILLVGLVLAILAASPTLAEDNPLREFFPYGVYVGGNNPESLKGPIDDREIAESINRVCKDLAEHHMNCVWLCNLPWNFLPMWLESGCKHGIRIIPQGGGPPSFVRTKWFKDKKDFARRVEPFYHDMATKYRNDSALLAWSITEENEPIRWFYESLADITNKMAQWDPNHPMITIDNKAATAWMNARIVKPKAMCRDIYPFFVDGLNGPYQPLGFRSILTRECRRFREAAKEADGVFWIMGQGMHLGGYRNDKDDTEVKATWRYPTSAEIRWQVWTSIQEGTKGFFFYLYRHGGHSHEGLRDCHGKETEQFRMAAQVGRQLKPLMPLILELDIAPPHEEVVYWENTIVTGQTFVHRKTGRRFLVTVNHDCENIQAIGIELGYWPELLREDEKLFNLRNRCGYDYQTFKLTTLLPGDGTIFLVGSDEEWSEFPGKFYP